MFSSEFTMKIFLGWTESQYKYFVSNKVQALFIDFGVWRKKYISTDAKEIWN